jgi:probable F420-dependent oxidoreductase
MLEPLTLLNYVAAITTRVKIGTSVIILPYRNPIVVAKMLATTDQLSAGRLIFGAAVGWMEPEFAALQAPFADRGAYSDECLRLIKTLWMQEKVSFEGRYFTFADMQASTTAVATTAPAHLDCGNSPRARRRVAEFGDGWHATPCRSMSSSQVSPMHAASGRRGDARENQSSPCASPAPSRGFPRCSALPPSTTWS